MSKGIKFTIFSLPAMGITFHSYLWIMGIVEGWPGDRVAAGVGFSVINYLFAAIFAGYVP